MNPRTRRFARRTGLGVAAVALLAFGVWALLVENDTRGGSDVCAVHHVKMGKVFVPVAYGLPSYRSRRVRIFQSELFPNSRASVGGGCSPGVPWWALVYRCPECAAARERWLASWNQLSESEQIAATNAELERRRAAGPAK